MNYTIVDYQLTEDEQWPSPNCRLSGKTIACPRCAQPMKPEYTPDMRGALEFICVPCALALADELGDHDAAYRKLRRCGAHFVMARDEVREGGFLKPVDTFFAP